MVKRWQVAEKIVWFEYGKINLIYKYLITCVSIINLSQKE